MNQRLSEIINYAEMSNTEFGKRIGASKQEVSNWLGGTKISVRRIKDILDTFPKINGHWFLTGEGNMIRGTGTQNTGYFNPENNGIHGIEYYKERVIELSEKLIECQEKNIELLERKEGIKKV